MKCYTCEKQYEKHEGALTLQSKIVGSYEVFNVMYYKCEGCGSLLLPKETAKHIEVEENTKKQLLLGQLPIHDFITSSEAIELLGITRQAFHKHGRIKKGFIYSATLDSKKFYLKKSVLLFKETGDGRFVLSARTAMVKTKYICIGSTDNKRNPYSRIENYSPHSLIEKQSHVGIPNTINKQGASLWKTQK